MSVESASSKVDQLLRELERLQRRLEGESRDEGRANDQLAQAHRSFESASGTFKASRLSDLNRKNQDLLAIQKKRASTQQAVAAKSADLNRAQAELAKAQLEEGKRRASADERLRRDQEARERTLRSQLFALRKPVLVAPSVSSHQPHAQFDVFISHATEDKEEIVRPLVEMLQRMEIRVWYDELLLTVGDSLRRKIDEGLVRSRFGIVVLSPSFFEKNWPQYELDGLVATENAAGQKVILPIWHRLTRDEVLARSPTLADRVALNTSVKSLKEIADELAAVVRDAF